MAKTNNMVTTQQLQQLESYAWVQKYRPVDLDEIILPSHVLDPIKKMVRVDKRIPHLLFTSVLPGSGKSTLAQVIINELEADALKVNASKDNGIDVIRNLVTPFATRFSAFDDAPQVVWFDEIDGTTPAFQDAFRVPMEEYDQTCSFIMTANYKEKISLAVQDRAQLFDFNLDNPKVKKEILIKIVKRVIFILDTEKITYDMDTVMRYCNKAYPRIRNIITGIQKYVTGNGNILDEGIMKMDIVDSTFYDFILAGEFTKAKDFVFKNSLNIDSLFGDMYRHLGPKLDHSKYAPVMITINRYAVTNGQVVDKELNFVAMLLEVIGIITS
jgi:replication-associated recombination protein RarA